MYLGSIVDARACPPVTLWAAAAAEVKVRSYWVKSSKMCFLYTLRPRANAAECPPLALKNLLGAGPPDLRNPIPAIANRLQARTEAQRGSRTIAFALAEPGDKTRRTFIVRRSLVLASKDDIPPIAGVPDPALLVVDDNEDNRYTLSLQLKVQGYHNVTLATNGHEAISILRSKDRKSTRLNSSH